MARVMTLEGLDPVRLGEIRARLDQPVLGQPELSWWHRPVTLQGLGGSSWPFWLGLASGALIGWGACIAVARRP